MKISIEIDDEVVSWFEKKADILGLDIDDLIEFIMKGYLRKNDPKKAVEMTNRNRVAAGMSVEKAKRFVALPVEKSLWNELARIAENKNQETADMIISLIENFAGNEG